MPITQDPTQPQVASYLKSAWYVRWGVTGIVAASFWFVPGVQKGPVAILLAVAAVFNLLLLALNRLPAIATNRLLILIADGSMSLLLVMYSGAVVSPYLLILAFMIISAAYWYGALAALATAALQTAVLLTYHWLQVGPAAFPRALAAQMLILAGTT